MYVLYITCTVGLPHNETTIAEYLKEVGYSTAIVGKWHLGVGANNEYLPTNHGFDQYYVSTLRTYVHIWSSVCTVYTDYVCAVECMSIIQTNREVADSATFLSNVHIILY